VRPHRRADAAPLAEKLLAPGESHAVFRIRDRRVRYVLAAALLVLIGVAAYWIGVRVWAGRRFRAAEEALQRFDFDQADELLTSYLAVMPHSAEGHFLSAQTARRRGDFTTAVRRLRLAQQNGTSAQTLATERDLIRIQSGDLTDSDGLVQFCADHPDDPEATLALEVLIEGSLKALHLARAKWAVDLWLDHRTGKPARVRGLVWRGRVNELAEELPQALADFRAALDIEPDHATARTWLVEVLIRVNPREAVADLERLRARRPDDPEVRFLTAHLRRLLGRPEEAARLLDDLLAAAPTQVNALVERGRVAMDLNRTDEAESFLRRALALAPEQREVNLALGDCLRLAGRSDDARPYQEKARAIEARLRKALEQMTTHSSTASGQPPTPPP